MFIEKLKLEDIQEFFNVKDCKINYIDLSYDGLRTSTYFSWSDYITNLRLTDTTGFDNDKKWIKFLYKIFGEEYKQWYLSEQAKIFDRI